MIRCRAYELSEAVEVRIDEHAVIFVLRVWRGQRVFRAAGCEEVAAYVRALAPQLPVHERAHLHRFQKHLHAVVLQQGARQHDRHELGVVITLLAGGQLGVRDGAQRALLQVGLALVVDVPVVPLGAPPFLFRRGHTCAPAPDLATCGPRVTGFLKTRTLVTDATPQARARPATPCKTTTCPCAKTTVRNLAGIQ